MRKFIQIPLFTLCRNGAADLELCNVTARIGERMHKGAGYCVHTLINICEVHRKEVSNWRC